MSTIFSKILSGEIPCFKVYEDTYTLAFLDIHPIQPGHSLVIPKTPSKNALEAHPDDLAHILRTGQKVALALQTVTKCEGINFIINNGAAAGQEVFHTHLHVIPRFTDDASFEEPLRGEYEDGEAVSLAVQLATVLKD